jgi:hypothetical protein
MYQTDPSEILPGVFQLPKQFRDRNIITLNATRALDQYWQEFHRKGRPGVGARPVAPMEVFGPTSLEGPLSHLIPAPQHAMEMVWAGQAANVLHMFTVASEMTTPYFQTCFNPQLSTIYWKFLTRPVHVDLTEGFDDPSWRQEQNEARKRLQQQEVGQKGSFAISRSKQIPNDFYGPSGDENRPVYTDLSRSTAGLPPQREKHTPNPFLFEPSLVPDEYGLFQAATGRRFDSMTDFLFLKSPHVEDIMSLLEYGVAFLRGSSLLCWTEVNTLIGFNVERIINCLLNHYNQDLDLNLVDRLVNSISIFALHREFTGQFSTIAPYMVMAFDIAVERGLHKIDPGNISRLILTVLYYTEIPEKRDFYEKLILETFADLPGIVLRERFSYVSGALLTPESQPEARDSEFWKKVERYLIEAELILPHLDTAVDLPAPCTILFKCLFAMMRAELGPRIGNHEWPIEQACLMATHLCSLGDHNTFIAVGLLVRFRIHSRRSSVYFNCHGRSVLVSDYLAEQIQNIPTMPVVPIIPGEEPFLVDAAKILQTQLPNIPEEPQTSPGFASHFPSSSSSRYPTFGQAASPDSPDQSTSTEPNCGPSHDESTISVAGSSASATASSHLQTPQNTVIIDNTSPFLKDTGTPEAPIVKKGTTYSKSIIGY